MPTPKDSYAKIEKAQKKYRNSEKGKELITRYNQSDAGRATREKYLKSELGRKALLRYYLSEKAETARQKRQALLKLFRRLDKYLRENPDKSIEDYFNQQPQKLVQLPRGEKEV